MSQTKEQIINELQDKGLVNDSNKEKFEAINKPELEQILSAYDKVDELTIELGGIEAKHLEELEEQTSEIQALKLQLAEEKVAAKEKAAELEPGLEFEFRGDKYKFLDKAPKTLRYGSKVLSQKEIAALEEEDLLQIVTNKSLIEKVK